MKYSLKRRNALLWSTNYSLEEIKDKLAKRKIDEAWLVCPLGEAGRAVTVSEFIAQPSMFAEKKSSAVLTGDQVPAPDAEMTVEDNTAFVSELTCGDSYEKSIDVLKANFGKLLGASLIYGFLVKMPVDILTKLGPVDPMLAFFGIAIGFFLSGPVGMSTNWLFLKAARKEHFVKKDMWAVFKRNYWPAVGAGFVKFVLIVAGLILFIVPGIVLACRLVFVEKLIIDRKMKVGEAFRASWIMTRSHSWTIFGMMLIALLLIIAGLLAFIVGVIFTSLIISAAFAVLYHSIEMKEGIPESDESANTGGVLALATTLIVGLFCGGIVWIGPRIAETAGPPSEPTLFRGNAYQIVEVPGKIRWEDAKARCEAMGGHLVIINDAAENEFLTTIGAGNKAYHLGATDQEKEGEWRWVDGRLMTYQTARKLLFVHGVRFASLLGIGGGSRTSPPLKVAMTTETRGCLFIF